MTHGEFVELLKSYTKCLENEKKFKAILGDLFPTETAQNNLLFWLFQMGLPKDIESSSEINNLIYHKYVKSLEQSYAVKKELAESAVEFWIVCYGRDVLGKKVSIPGVVSDVIDFESEGLKEKSFKHCPFRVYLPDMTVLDGRILIRFRIVDQPGISVDVSLNEIYLFDKLGRKYDNFYSGLCKLKKVSNKDYSLEVPIKGKQFLMTDSGLILTFLAGNHYRYEISYTFKNSHLAALNYVMGRKMSAEEIGWLEASLKKASEQVKPVPVPPAQPSDTGKSEIPDIEDYKKAILKEKYFLQKGGGHKHKLSNGKLLSRRNGMCSYSFEMESELNLTDDAPIKLTVGGISAAGNVIVCEGFRILVSIDRDFGQNIGQAMLGVEPWKLLEALVERLDGLTSHNKLALKLIQEGPKFAGSDDLNLIPKGQTAAVDAFHNNDITVIWGPPGTGKTYTMAQIARDGLQQGKKILVVSHSNVSVDGVVKQTVDGLRSTGMDGILKAGKVLRYGYVRDEELAQDAYAVAYNYALIHRPDLKVQMDILRREKEDLKNKGEYNTEKGEQIEKKLHALRADVRNEERQYADRANLVATTISKVTIDPLFDEKEYDIVMFDEVSMAYVPQIICAAMYAKEKLILVGDFRQLAPIVQSDPSSVLSKDIFAYLGISDNMKVLVHPWLVMLNEQRRMHPEISAFPNRYIYGNLLTDHSSVYTKHEEIIKRDPMGGHPANLINLSGTYCASMKNSDNSRFNILSAIVAFSTALQAEENGEESVGIITPYAAQTRLIRAMIQDYRKQDETDVACSTVHQFQGSERNVIIFDAVESYPASNVGWLMGKKADSVTRLINVAVTRARGKLVVLANARFWENKFAGTAHIFYQLIRYLTGTGNVISVKDKSLQAYISGFPYLKNVRFYNSSADAMMAFKADLGNVKDKVVISMPDGKLNEETESMMLKLIMNASANGIRILSKTNGYQDLPEGWKKITWGTENAVFPLIMLDDKVLWYGLPYSRGMFTDGNAGYMTAFPIVYRIRGEHTLEIIKTFSDLEERVVNGQKQPLLEKKADSKAESDSGNDDGNESAGLDAFVKKMVKCPKCKSPMSLAKGKSGKVYMRCTSPSCKEIAYLTPEITNWYIKKEGITCPYHHCGIHASVGQYGIYVKCEQGHYLKANEI